VRGEMKKMVIVARRRKMMSGQRSITTRIVELNWQARSCDKGRRLV
jgi:hypothetical protein